MRILSKKRLSVIFLVLALLLTLLPGVTFAADIQVIIEQSDTEAQIEQKITNAVLQTAGGGTVTVTGSKTNVGDTICLPFYDETTIVWKAVYYGSSSNGALIELYGGGLFEIAEGADIQCTKGTAVWSGMNYDTVAVVMSGGSIESSRNAIACGTGNVLVSGGTISTTGEDGIAVYSSKNVTVSGNALIRASGASAYAIYSDRITIQGGTVETTGEGAYVLYANDNVAEITGGTIRATGDYSHVVHNSSGNIIMTGGTVEVAGKDSIGFYGNAAVMGGSIDVTGEDSYAIYSFNYIAAYLAGSCNGDFGFAPYDEAGVIVEVDSLTIPTDRHGTAEGLTVIPGSYGIATWDCSGDIPIIIFEIDNDWGYHERAMEWGVEPGSPSILRGDANEDGDVDSADAAAILRHLAGLATLTEQGLLNAKLTNDEEPVSAADAALLLRFLANLISEL
ncbi:MAG: dockerin type I domain-containing protein [Clostridiales bacterium]|nr:dockerin type I domain-containing protein [Clostridiales bacterium]